MNTPSGLAPIEDEKRLPLADHLRELRQRLIYAMGALGFAFVGAWLFHRQLFAWFMEPYRLGLGFSRPEDAAELAFRGITEPIVVYLKTAGVAALLLAAPFILLQIWLFVAPGLYRHERRMALPFLSSAYLFFLGGVAFCRYVVLEPAIAVLIGFGDSNTVANIMMEDYFSFAARMLIVFGVLFELPVAISFLSWARIVTARGLIAVWRYAIVVAFVVGGMLTPPDPLTQLALAVPLTLLYVLSIGLAWLIERSRADAPPVPESP